MRFISQAYRYGPHMFTHYNHSPHKSSKGLSTYTRGMQCIECFIALPFATCIHNNRLISRSSPLPTVACNTKGGKCLVMRLGCLKHSWNNIAWVTMCLSGWLCACVHCTHSASLLWNSSYSCRQQSLQAIGGGLKSLQVKNEGSTP